MLSAVEEISWNYFLSRVTNILTLIGKLWKFFPQIRGTTQTLLWKFFPHICQKSKFPGYNSDSFMKIFLNNLNFLSQIFYWKKFPRLTRTPKIFKIEKYWAGTHDFCVGIISKKSFCNLFYPRTIFYHFFFRSWKGWKVWIYYAIWVNFRRIGTVVESR